jgi:hypothetical protein
MSIELHKSKCGANMLSSYKREIDFTLEPLSKQLELTVDSTLMRSYNSVAVSHGIELIQKHYNKIIQT